VLSLFLHWVQTSPYSDIVEHSSWDGADAWPGMVVLYAMKHNIDIGDGVHNMKADNNHEKWVLTEKYRPNKFGFKELVGLDVTMTRLTSAVERLSRSIWRHANKISNSADAWRRSV